LLLIAFFPVLYLTAAARFDQAQAADGQLAGSPSSLTGQRPSGALELDLQQNPEDLKTRGVLMAFYANGGNEAGFTRHLLWVIDHYPDAAIAGMRFFSRRDQTEASKNREPVKAAWERALATHPDSAEVLYHAGLGFVQDDPQRGLALFKRARDLAPPRSHVQGPYVHAIAMVYSAAVISDLHSGNARFRLNGIAMAPNIAGGLRTELEISNDPGLLSQVGTTLVSVCGAETAPTGLDFIQRAIDLEPGNPNWTEALESAKAEPTRRSNLRKIAAAGQTPGASLRR